MAALESLSTEIPQGQRSLLESGGILFHIETYQRLSACWRGTRRPKWNCVTPRGRCGGISLRTTTQLCPLWILPIWPLSIVGIWKATYESVAVRSTKGDSNDLSPMAMGIPASLEASRLVAHPAGVLRYPTGDLGHLAGCNIVFYPPAPRKEHNPWVRPAHQQVGGHSLPASCSRSA